MAILVNKNTRVIVQGLTGREGTFHAKAMRRLRHTDRRRSNSGQGRHHARRLADLQYRARRRGEDRRQRNRDFCAAAVRRRCDHGSGRRRDRSDRLHHRRHSHARHGEGLGIFAGPAFAADRAELSGDYFAGQVQDRHHAGIDSQRRFDRHRVAIGHADL